MLEDEGCDILWVLIVDVIVLILKMLVDCFKFDLVFDVFGVDLLMFIEI